MRRLRDRDRPHSADRHSTAEPLLRGARTLLLAVLLAGVPTSCGGPSVAVPTDGTAALELIASLIEAEDFDTALDVIDSLERESYIGEPRASLDAMRMQALFGLEEYWDSFKVAQDFVDENRFSPKATLVEQLEFAAGKALLADDDSSGEVVLEHFITRFDSSPSAPEALKLLGEAAFAARRYEIAEVRFSELLQSHPSSEWAAYARYRLAMTSFRRVRGPSYDLDQMQLARNELAHYLALDPERPEFREEAARALATLEVWLAGRHLEVADFYRTVGNLPGERMHLERAAGQFATTAAGERARQRLAAFDVERPASADEKGAKR